MNVATGEYSKSLESSSSLNKLSWKTGVLEIAVLALLGVSAVVLHRYFRIPLNLPGRHGVEWMALLVAGRAFSRFRAAGTVGSTSAALFSLLPYWGASGEPLGWLTYWIAGVAVDLVINSWPQLRQSLWALILLGAIGHVTKPLLRALITWVTGLPFHSLWNGVLYPLLTHLLFGATGGLLAGVTVKAWRRIRPLP